MNKEIRKLQYGKVFGDNKILRKNPVLDDLKEGTYKVFDIPGVGLRIVCRHNNKLYYSNFGTNLLE